MKKFFKIVGIIIAAFILLIVIVAIFMPTPAMDLSNDQIADTYVREYCDTVGAVDHENGGIQRHKNTYTLFDDNTGMLRMECYNLSKKTTEYDYTELIEWEVWDSVITVHKMRYDKFDKYRHKDEFSEYDTELFVIPDTLCNRLYWAYNEPKNALAMNITYDRMKEGGFTKDDWQKWLDTNRYNYLMSTTEACCMALIVLEDNFIKPNLKAPDSYERVEGSAKFNANKNEYDINITYKAQNLFGVYLRETCRTTLSGDIVKRHIIE